MTLRYHYSIVPSFLFLGLGIALLFFAYDLLYLHEVVREADAPPKYVAYITLFLGFMVTSGFFMNLIKGKDYVLEADSHGITVYTKSITSQLPKISIAWKDVLKFEVKKIRSVFNTNRNDHVNRGLAITVKPDLIEWPSVMIARNRIHFHRGQDHDEVIIDAWLNKSKSTIVDEIKTLAIKTNPDLK